MNQTDLSRQWRAMAPTWITETRHGRNPHRAGLLDRAMLQACGDVTSLTVLDSGCGEGRFSRMLVARGAKRVLGLDLCEPFIEAAQQLESGRDDYRIADVQNLNFLADQSFDLAVSYLNQCDLPDFGANTREVFRVLRPGGRFVIANLHPMRSSLGKWLRAPDGSREHVMLDRYFDEGERTVTSLGHEFTNFHRTLASYVRGFLEAGFAIEGMVEPTVTTDEVARYPELDDELRVPNFITYLLTRE